MMMKTVASFFVQPISTIAVVVLETCLHFSSLGIKVDETKTAHFSLLFYCTTTANTPCPEKRGKRFFLHNFNKCRHSFVLFGTNHPEDSLY